MRKPLVLLALLVFLLCGPALAAVPTTINYQGHLSASGGPASGLLPFHFSIYDAESGGNLLWADLDTLNVVNGLFSAQLGANTPIPTIVFNVPATWLETAVNGQVLAPRIPFASVPYAQFAQHADTASVAMSYTGAGQWASDGTNVWRPSGKVGIGTATPLDMLSVAGNAGNINIGKNHSGFNGIWLNGSTNGDDYNLLSSGPNGDLFLNRPAGKIIYFRESNVDQVVINSGGNVGIGTLSPLRRLDVNGAMMLKNRDAETQFWIAKDVSGTEHSFYMTVNPDFRLNYAVNGVWQSAPFTINTTGNFGFGTTNPQAKVDVIGGIRGDQLFTSGASLGNGSVFALLDDDHLAFVGTYGYTNGPEYIEFQSNYNPGVGGQGTMARITADRDPVGYDYGQGRIKLSVRNGSSLKDVVVLDQAGVSIYGAMNVTGTKCRVVEGTKYGTLYYNAVESGHALFTLDGEAQLKDGIGWVALDPKWLAGVTVDDQHPMQVWITFYGPHDEYYVQRANSNSGFKVVETSGSNAAFGWKVEARQKGYEDVYLNRPEPVAKK